MSQDDCEQLKEALHAANMAVWEIDITSGTVFYSPAVEQLCGLTPGMFGGTYQCALQCVHPEDRARIDQESRDLLVTGTGSRAEFRLLRPDGEVRWVESFGALLRDGQGRPARVVGVAMDITERKQMEQALRTSNEELIHFCYAASHDLQEPLRAVTAFGQLLQGSLNGHHGKDTGNYLRFILDGADRLHILLRDLRVYTEVSQDAGDDPGFVDCSAVLQEVCINLRAAIADSAAVITRDPLPVAPGRKIHFVELFQNLLSNAIKYRGSGPPIIHVSAQWRADECVFSVRDNGMGIGRKDAKEIFGAFKRLSRDLPGTGMGLAICKRIVEHAGGRIWVESEPGQGSTFYFTVRSNHAAARVAVGQSAQPLTP